MVSWAISMDAKRKESLKFHVLFTIWIFLSPNIKVSLEAKTKSKRSSGTSKKHEPKSIALNVLKRRNSHFVPSKAVCLDFHPTLGVFSILWNCGFGHNLVFTRKKIHLGYFLGKVVIKLWRIYSLQKIYVTVKGWQLSIHVTYQRKVRKQVVWVLQLSRQDSGIGYDRTLSCSRQKNDMRKNPSGM